MRSIARTLTISLSTAAAAIFAIVLGIVVWADETRDLQSAQCKAVIGIVAGSLIGKASGAPTLRETPALRSLQRRSPDLWFAVVSSSGAEQFASEHQPTWAAGLLLPAQDLTKPSIATWHPFNEVPCLAARRAGSTPVIVMASGMSMTRRQLVEAYLLRNTAVLVLVALAFAVTVMAGVMLSAWFVARSIARVTATALAVDPAALRASIPLDDVPIELAALVRALNRAFEQIDVQMSRQRRFLGNAAHELRTPLTLLRTKLEDVYPPPLRGELVRDVRHLSSLVSTMLDLARLQHGHLAREAVDLVVMSRAVLADYAPTALNSGVELSLEAVGTVTIEGVEPALRSALANLISNALSHAKGANRIVTEIGNGQIKVSDDGAGVPAGEVDALLKPFTKGESEGAGLGLAIVEEIMLAHGGRLEIQSLLGGGLIASMIFPVRVP